MGYTSKFCYVYIDLLHDNFCMSMFGNIIKVHCLTKQDIYILSQKLYIWFLSYCGDPGSTPLIPPPPNLSPHPSYSQSGLTVQSPFPLSRGGIPGDFLYTRAQVIA